MLRTYYKLPVFGYNTPIYIGFKEDNVSQPY